MDLFLNYADKTTAMVCNFLPITIYFKQAKYDEAYRL